MSFEKKIKKMFQAPRKGETFELRAGLVSQYASERNETIKQVIAAMTVGKDVSSLFPDVLKNIATHDLKQKKLVYLYLMNYAKTNPELCILAVNTFVKDTEDPNPLVRALAIRTMGCIRVDKMVDYMEIPLNKTLADENPYVRKTAAICVAKLFDLNREVCIENGFLEKLQKLVEDSNPMVVANAISALAEIHETDPSLDVLTVDSTLLKKLLMALNECTEWGRITILTAVSEYETTEADEPSHIIERVIPQLQHSNPSVVLAAIKVIINNVEKISDKTEYENVLKKLGAPLASLVSTPAEVQYVTLRNIRIIIEKYPEILTQYYKVFFVRYNDPLYLKLEKIEVIVRLAREKNASFILNELKEYGYEFDVEFVKRAVKGIGQVGIKVGKYSNKAIDVLIGLINERELYDEVVVALRDILRAYPERSDMVVTTIVQAQDKLVDAEAISSLIWVLGEYEAANFETKLSDYVDNFNELDVPVQNALVYSLVKINVKTGQLKDLLAKIFNNVESVENVEVRDQIFLYWRILSLDDSNELKKMILTRLNNINTTIPQFQPEFRDALLKEISTLNSVLFTTSVGKGAKTTHITKIKDARLSVHNDENLLDFDDDGSGDANNGNTGSDSINILDELNDLFSSSTIQPSAASSSVPAAQTQSTTTSGVSKDLLDLF
ncbi:CYFA0S13e01178g1_1 [Cyberlindnera fabianii]|uniref:AP complex subunit beta n=1 Tax=Cyberlindnera fabianii TaxID=36022 RepID=A0A061B2E5_CYBFA|nr:CYFA0S13e01178g1_1 [Cyberlindnera fabianii]